MSIKPLDYWLNKIHCGNAFELLKQLPAESIDMAITSPPYWGLRKYNTVASYGSTDKKRVEMYLQQQYIWFKQHYPQYDYSISDICFSKLTKEYFGSVKADFKTEFDFGTEKHPQSYINHVVLFCQLLKRVLKPTGSLWINLGDTYFGSSRWSKRQPRRRKEIILFEQVPETKKEASEEIENNAWLQPKQKLLIPERIAIALQNEGFCLRSDIIWYKPNHSPSSVKDRLMSSWEHVYFFVKQKRYFFDMDAIRQPHIWASRDKRSLKRRVPIRSGKSVTVDAPYSSLAVGYHPLGKVSEDVSYDNSLARRKSKFLLSKEKTASPAARALRTLSEGKLTTQTKQQFLDVGAYLKQKRKKQKISIEELAELTGMRESTLAHYFRTDFSGQALPDKQTWEALKPILNLGNYEDFITEEIRSALPQIHPLGRAPEDFWSICTQPFRGVHFSVFPGKLCEVPIKATCPEWICDRCGKIKAKIDCGCNAGWHTGVVLDPFCGSGTTCVVARKLLRNFIGFELNPSYAKMARQRVAAIGERLDQMITSFLEVE